jgi:hypothetical protein
MEKGLRASSVTRFLERISEVASTGRSKGNPVQTPEPRQREEETDEEQDHEHM